MTIEELQNAPRRNGIDPMIFYDEKWKKIDFIEDILPIYWISNHGRVYNEKTGYIMDGHLDSKGYEIVSFYKINRDRIWCHTHRLLMLAFVPIENPENYVVNHIDGIKYHNYDYNLEWVTHKENIKHAFELGLRGKGEDSSHVIFSNEQVHKVCKCMENGYTTTELSLEVFGKHPDQQIRSLCKNIYSRKFWTDISCQYNIENFKRNNIFSDPQIRIICKCLEDNLYESTLNILSKLNIVNFSDKEFEVYDRAICNIRIGKSFTRISREFNI